MKWCTNNRGFSLVELLVAMVVMGLVTAAVYTTFLSTQRQAYTQDEVVEVQQNLRAALDFLVKDIRMAQFMTPTDETALVTVPSKLLDDANDDGDYDDTGERSTLSLVSATSMHGYARISQDVSSSPTITLAPNTLQQFVAGDIARIFRPADLEPVSNSCTILSKDLVNNTVTLNASVTAMAGDLLVMVPSGADDGDATTDDHLQIDYRLVDDPSGDVNMNQLRRRVIRRKGGAVDPSDASDSADPEKWPLVASKISGLELTYLDKNGDSTTDLDEIVALQVTITGQTDATKTGRSNYSGVKQRSLATTVKIHNEVRL